MNSVTTFDSVIHHERHDLYCCLLPRCEALRTCRSGFPIATVLQNKDKSYKYGRYVSPVYVVYLLDNFFKYERLFGTATVFLFILCLVKMGVHPF